MKIELRNVKHAEFASQETHCFTATVYLNDIKAGTVRNDGHGGPDYFDPPALETKLDTYGLTLPEYEFLGTKSHHTAETLIGEILNDWLVERDLKRSLKKRVLYTRTDRPGIYQTKMLSVIDLQKLTDSPPPPGWNVKEILNKLPLSEAAKIYRQAVVAYDPH